MEWSAVYLQGGEVIKYMKKISILINAYNEVKNVRPLAEALEDIFRNKLPEYDYEIIFIDNHSDDGTREELRQICKENKKVKAILNARNFGAMRSQVHGLKQITGDCAIKMVADFQEPLEMIVDFVREWEKGTKIVIGVKTASKENFLMYFVRSCYYKIIRKITDINHIEHFTGFGLYDRAFIEVLQGLHDPLPYLRGIVAELGYDYVAIPYEQPKRRSGKSKHNWYALFDIAMIGITSYSKVPLRLATMTGFILAGASAIIGLVYLIYKLVFWYSFSAGTAPILIGFFFIGAVQLIFLGLLGEYISCINIRVMDRPLVVEEERINFEVDDEKELEGK